jgi:hypothetical protein
MKLFQAVFRFTKRALNIVDFMSDKKFEPMPKPYQVAAQMYAAGVWEYPLFAPPEELADEPDIYF